MAQQGARYTPTQKDRDQVAMLSGMGIPVWDVARVMQLSEPTLRKYFADELKLGQIKAATAVARSLYKQATDPVKPSVVAAIFWLKCRAGWREEDRVAPTLEDLGKKEILARAAKTAEQGSGWDGLLN